MYTNKKCFFKRFCFQYNIVCLVALQLSSLTVHRGSQGKHPKWENGYIVIPEGKRVTLPMHMCPFINIRRTFKDKVGVGEMTQQLTSVVLAEDPDYWLPVPI